MSEPLVQTAPTPTATSADAVTTTAETPKAEPRAKPGIVMRALKAIASLRLTVFLFVLSLLLVFFGTLAQIDNGIWSVMAAYFRSVYVWVPFKLFAQFGHVFFGLPREVQFGGSFPFPGGLTLGVLLLVNLLAAHAIRFKLSWKRSGVLTLHAGLIVLLVGEGITRFYAVEQRMTMGVGERVDFTDVSQRVELALTTSISDTEDRHIVVPQNLLTQLNTRIRHDDLPVDVEVLKYWKNTAFIPVIQGESPVVNGLVNFKRPKEWTDERAKGILLKDKKQEARIKISRFEVSEKEELPGGLLPNINRWRKEVGLKPATEEEVKQLKFASAKVGTETGRLLVLENEDKSAVIVWLKNQGATWFFKLMGDSDLVKANREKYDEFLESVSFVHLREAVDGSKYAFADSAESSGVDTDAREDAPSAEVVLYKKGTDEELGRFFVSLYLYGNSLRRTIEFVPETIPVDGKIYAVQLRPKREYKEYALQLKEFTHEKYPGTTTPRNFASLVDLRGKGEERREANIYMNNPMYERGETYYQSGYFPNNSGTVLQVVRNPGWVMPYLACFLVTVGMSVHFILALINFLQKRATNT